MKKKIPEFKTDEEVEHFVDTADFCNTTCRAQGPCASNSKRKRLG
jgi:hypothetical protein